MFEIHTTLSATSGWSEVWTTQYSFVLIAWNPEFAEDKLMRSLHRRLRAQHTDAQIDGSCFDEQAEMSICLEFQTAHATFLNEIRSDIDAGRRSHMQCEQGFWDCRDRNTTSRESTAFPIN
jgi:hypothetical protein